MVSHYQVLASYPAASFLPADSVSSGTKYRFEFRGSSQSFSPPIFIHILMSTEMSSSSFNHHMCVVHDYHVQIPTGICSLIESCRCNGHSHRTKCVSVLLPCTHMLTRFPSILCPLSSVFDPAILMLRTYAIWNCNRNILLYLSSQIWYVAILSQ